MDHLLSKEKRYVLTDVSTSRSITLLFLLFVLYKR